MSATSVAIIGGSGYTGGELLRLLADHPAARVSHVTSRRLAGSYVHSVHPHLRGRVNLTFVAPEAVESCDVAMLCMPHGESSRQIERWSRVAGRVIDLSADFRIRDPRAYRRWYGEDHPAPAWLDRFTYGLPETRRETLRGLKFASGVGCNATAVTLALLPLARAGLIASVVADVKVGSSEGGAEHSAASHHPLRSGSVRSFAPIGHRHQAEIAQELMDGPSQEPAGGDTDPTFDLRMSVTSIERVRGVLCTSHVTTRRPVDDREMWAMYRGAYASEPFVRIVRDRAGLHRYPDPKVVCGSNYADVGWEIEPGTTRVVVISAIDNLVKGAAGSAVQCMNLMLGIEETSGLTFPGVYPA